MLFLLVNLDWIGFIFVIIVEVLCWFGDFWLFDVEEVGLKYVVCIGIEVPEKSIESWKF